MKEYQNQEKKFQNIISTGISELNSLVDVNTIVGKPIYNGDDVIIPITKLTFSILSGGGEYGETKFIKKNENFPMSAGSGTVVSIKPIGFLVKNASGNYKLLSVSNDSIERLIDRASDYIDKTVENEK